MIDVNKITSTLAKLPDAQLQQYAQMHKADPYIMSLAMSESNRRKEMRAAGQGAQGMQEQPKVVDQMVAEMAPEDQGIGQLNAGNMNFAGGGIIAFADGGDVERFNGTQSQFVQDVAGIPGTYDKWWQANREEDRIKAERERAMEQRRQDELAARQKTSFANYLFGSPEREAAGKTELAQLAATPIGTASSLENVSGMDRRLTAGSQPNIASFKTPLPPKASDAAPKTDIGKGTGKGSGAGTGAGSGAAPAGSSLKGSASLEALYKKLQPSDAEYAAVEAKENSVANALKNLGKSGLEEFEAEEAKRGDVFKGREARLAKSESELEARKSKNEALALIFGGATIAGTSGGLAKALSEGIKTGGAQYAAGIDKINAAQERLMDAKDRLEELRVNRDDLTSRERRQLKNQAKQYELEAEKLFLDGTHKKLGYKRDDAKNMFAGITTLMGQETAAGATIEAANIRSRDQKEYLAELRGGSLVEQTRKSIMDNIIKANPYADEPTRQRLYQTEWAKALQSNPALAKYAGVAPGGGGASSADPLGLR